MLAMMVGAVVLGRAVDDDTADQIIKSARESILDAREKGSEHSKSAEIKKTA